MALRRVIGIEGAFYERYIRLKRNSRVWARVKDRARKCDDKARQLYAELRDNYPDAWEGASQENVARGAYRDIERMFKTALPRKT